MSLSRDQTAYLEFLQRTLSGSKDIAIFGKPGLSITDFEIEAKALGSGASGQVYKARPKGGDGRWYAMKRFDLPMASHEPEANMARREMEKAAITQLPLTAKNQSFIVRLFAVIDDAENKYRKGARV